MNKLILHLGVHKTATTYFQSRLYNSINILNEYSVGYLGLDDTREHITSKLHQNSQIPSSVMKRIEKFDTFLISDENILGGTDKINDSLIYPDVEKRLLSLINKFEYNQVEVNLTIREPESYLVSRYSEYLRHYPFISMAQYFENFEAHKFSWLPLVNKIEDALKCKVNITLFESVFKDETKYLNSITNLNIEYMPADEGASIKRSKISNESYRILEHLADHYPSHMTKRLIAMMANNKPKGKHTRLQPFSPEVSTILKNNYLHDKEKMSLIGGQ